MVLSEEKKITRVLLILKVESPLKILEQKGKRFDTANIIISYRLHLILCTLKEVIKANKGYTVRL